MITDIKQLDLNKRYTYADYLSWQFDDMVELIKGKVFKMSPAPNRLHQEVSSVLHTCFGSYLRKKPCKVYSAPFDVRLSLPPSLKSADKINTVVQPDICVVCDPSKLDYRGCNGTPDLVIEILSESTAQKDLNEKFDLYQHAGVPEYWIVHPHEQTLMVYVLDENGSYKMNSQKPYTKNEKVTVGIFPDLLIDLGEVFDNLQQ